MLITDLTYSDDGELIVHVTGRGENNEKVTKHIYGTEPYLFVPDGLVVPSDRRIADIRRETQDGEQWRSYDDVPLKQIVTEYPSDVGSQWKPGVRDEFDKEDRYEDDVPYVRRVAADYGLSGYVQVPREEDQIHVDEVESVERPEDEIEPRVIISDIEVRVPDEFTQEFIDEAPNEVTAITCWDSYQDRYVLFALDGKNKVDPLAVRENIREQWDNLDEDEYSECDIGFRRYHDEGQLLEDFVTYLHDRQPDLISGWNFVDFDWEYLITRMSKFDVGLDRIAEIGNVNPKAEERKIEGLPAMDMMSAYCGFMSYGQWRSQSLDYVSNEELGVGKIEQAQYDVDRSKFMAYNIVDVQLCVALDRLHGIHEFYYQMSDICGLPIYDVGSSMKMVEGFLFKHRTHEEILPSTPDQDIGNIRGGFVLPPSDGIADWIGVFDLKSLYPSSIITCNISKETFTTDPEEADVVCPDMPLNYEQVAGSRITESDIGWQVGEGECVGFSLEKEGIVPKYIQRLFDERARFKQLRDEYVAGADKYSVYDNKQRAVKVLMNTFFGVMDNPYFRLSMPGLGEAITGTSRYISWAGTKIIENADRDVRYGDTDSLLVQLMDYDEDPEDIDVDEIVDRGEELETEINSQISEYLGPLGLPDEHPFAASLHGPEKHCWVYEFEKLYRRFLQLGSKKRYAGRIVWKEGQRTDDMDIVGFQAKRTDIPEIAAEVQEEVMNMVLEGAGFDELSNYVREKTEAIKNQSIHLKEIGYPGSINKPLSEYPNRPTPRACEYGNNYLDGYDWGPGDSPWIVYIDSTPPGYPGTDVLAVDWTDRDLPEGFELDAQKHIEKYIKGPIEGVIGETQWTWQELESGKENKPALGGW